jgi:dTDP-4-amino-4,6-dideoxygalactose transaminase
MATVSPLIERIPFLDLKAEYAQLAQDGLEQVLLDSLRGAHFIGGRAVRSFEEHWAAYCGTSEAVALDSGTAALQLVLKALDIGPGDEVVVPAHTFIATAAAVALCGARPLFVDADAIYWQMDLRRLENAITSRTKAVISVHLFGQPSDMARLSAFCTGRGLFLIEDAAQAQGATFQRQRVGSFGTAGCFSFYPAKNLGAFGDAGAVTTNDPQLAARVRRLADHGRMTKYEHTEIGHNLRMDEMQGVVLDFKLAYLDGWNQRRREIAALYRERLTGLPIFLPASVPGTEPVHHLFPIGLEEREDLMRHLAERAIDCGIHYPIPLHLQPAFAHLGYERGAMPIAEKIGAQELSLPIGPMLSDEHVEIVCDAIQAFFR